MGSRWWMWLGLAGLLGLTHGCVVTLANQLDATVRALYWDPVGLGLAVGAMGLRVAWWTGGPALVGVGLGQGLYAALSRSPREPPSPPEAPDAHRKAARPHLHSGDPP